LILIYIMLPGTKKAFDMEATGGGSSAAAPPPASTGTES
jgi:hypothetical protein